MSDSDSEARTGTEILHLAQDFPPVPTAAWEAVIQKDLKGADYEKKLVWRSDEGVAVRPYYRSENLAGLDAQTASVPGRFPFVRGNAKAWEIDQEAVPPAERDSGRSGPRSRRRRHPAGWDRTRVGR